MLCASVMFVYECRLLRSCLAPKGLSDHTIRFHNNCPGMFGVLSFVFFFLSPQSSCLNSILTAGHAVSRRNDLEKFRAFYHA